MLFYILLGIIGIAVLVFLVMLWTDGFSELFDKFMFSLILFLFGAFVGMVAWGLCAILSIFFGQEVERESGRWELQAITTNSGTAGSFFLGTGYIGEVQSYIFYYRDGDGFRMDSVPADDTLVIEKKNVQPMLYEFELYDRSGLWMPEKYQDKEYSWTVVIPEGSIKPMVNMNLPGVED